MTKAPLSSLYLGIIFVFTTSLYFSKRVDENAEYKLAYNKSGTAPRGGGGEGGQLFAPMISCFFVCGGGGGGACQPSCEYHYPIMIVFGQVFWQMCRNPPPPPRSIGRFFIYLL